MVQTILDYNDLNNLSNLMFKTYYPDVFNFVKTYKNGVKDRMDYELVKLETDFIFNHVCQRLYNEIPGIQLLTCHDEIYFEERYYEQVIRIWDEEIEKVYNKIPVKVEPEIDFDKNALEALGHSSIHSCDEPKCSFIIDFFDRLILFFVL